MPLNKEEIKAAAHEQFQAKLKIAIDNQIATVVDGIPPELAATPEGQAIVAQISGTQPPNPMPIIEDLIDSILDPLIDALNPLLEGLETGVGAGITPEQLEAAIDNIPTKFTVEVVADIEAPSGYAGNIVEIGV